MQRVSHQESYRVHVSSRHVQASRSSQIQGTSAEIDLKRLWTTSSRLINANIATLWLSIPLVEHCTMQYDGSGKQFNDEVNETYRGSSSNWEILE